MTVKDRATEGMTKIGIDRKIVRQIVRFPENVKSILVYGSRARGDALEESDIDILALVTKPTPSLNYGDISISCYTPHQMETGIGTLFGAHLKRDSKILVDDDGELQRIVESMGPVNTDRLFARSREISRLFTTPEFDLPKYLPGLLREARYLLRSCLYASAIRDGNPCFSVREISHRLNEPDLIALLSSRNISEPSMAEYHKCTSKLAQIIGPFPGSRHGSLEATIINEWDRPGDILSAAFLALGRTGEGGGYAEVEKILL